MNTYIKTTMAIILLGLSMPVIAANRFIVMYKLTESQKTFLESHSGADKKQAKAQIRKELMRKLSKEQLDNLSKAANVKVAATNIQVEDWHSLGDGAHVIILSEDLDEIQTEQFIHNVEQDSNIEFIEEDKIMELVL